MTNGLARERSLYLRQHADNPVDWRPWGPEAFAEAKRLDRPVFVSSGYSSCHWCHVMAHESFEDAAVAAYLNAHFVCIKLDREEHPDVDAQYMTAVVLISGHGGWPMSVFALPDGRPFFAGTYFPKTPRYGQPGFLDLLQRIVAVWTGERGRLLEDAARVADGVRLRSQLPPPVELTGDGIHTAIADSLASHDPVHGGHQGAPKFPPHVDLRLWLHCQAVGDRSPEIEQALRLTLDKLAWSGLRDQLGGGFHRYCVDEAWRVPHFEQMLYDNAQLLDAYATAVLLRNDDADRWVLNCLLLELRERWRTDAGWCAAAWDADDPGGEGGFYTWTPDELREALLDDAPRAAKYFRVEAQGPVEGRSTLNPAWTPGREDLDPNPEETWSMLRHHVPIMSRHRETRPRPQRDDKGIVGENGLLLAGLARAARVVGREALADWGHFAETLLTQAAADALPRAWYPGESRGRGGLEDYAGLGLGLLRWGLTFDAPAFLARSLALAEEAVSRFGEGGWRATENADLFGPPAGYQDGQHPSPLSLALEWLSELGAVTGGEPWHQACDEILHAASGAMARLPTGTRDLWRGADRLRRGLSTVFLVGPETDAWHARLAGRGRPDLLWIRPACAAWLATEDAPAMTGRRDGHAYHCLGRICAEPATSLSQLAGQLGLG